MEQDKLMDADHMELIDKHKLLEWLNERYLNDSISHEQARPYNHAILAIKSGTFDDHSAQEEIADLQAANRIANRQIEHFRARVIQAEQEQDKAVSLLRQKEELRKALEELKPLMDDEEGMYIIRQALERR